MDVKTLKGARVEIKDAAKGEIDCVFATLGVKDSDGDVSVKGSFTDGQPVRISAYGHMSWMGRLPVGKGSIREVGNEAIMSGKFFMNVPEAKSTFLVVDGLKELQDWSYGYDPDEYSFGDHEGEQVRFLKRQTVHEVSPVLLGAGVNTRTLGTKSALSFLGEATAVLAAVTGLADRAAEVMAMRAEKGKDISADSAAMLARIEAQCKRWTQAPQSAPDSTTEDQAALVKAYLSDIRRRHPVGV